MYGPAARPWLLLLLLALLASCAPGHTLTPAPPSAGPGSYPAGETAVGADRLTPLTDGPAAFRTIKEKLASAARSIHLEMYEFQREDLAFQIMEAHQRGVEVTAIMDPSERTSRNIWMLLRQAGIQVVAFPVEPRTIDHVKLLIVDGAFAVVGGINWGRHSEEHRDYDVLAAGPVVANLERVFEQDLALAGRPTVLPQPQPDRMVQVLVTRPGDGLKTAVLAAIGEARRSIDIEMFVLSDRVVLESLIAAVRRGVQVRVLLDPNQPQNLESMAALRAAGASVRLYQSGTGRKLHAKLGIFDAGRLIFGSCNWSRSGFTRNHELDLEISSEAVSRTFLGRLEMDWSGSIAA